jgi:mono/diheme cytochrome c family protein
MPVAARKSVFGLVGAAVAVAAAVGFYAVYSGPPTAGGADANDKALVALGETVYRANCGSCHGVRLEGEADWRTARNADGTLKAPPHDHSGHTWHHPDQVLFDYTKRGGQALAPKDFKSGMPGFGEALSDRQIWAALAFIKSQWPADIRDKHRQINERSR